MSTPCPPSHDIPSSVQVFTHNITRHPIAWDPARQRPTQELVHSIHSALHFALDPCVNHPDEQPSFCVVNEHDDDNDGKPDPCVPSRKQLVIPCIDDLRHVISHGGSSSGSGSNSPNGKASKDEVTVKLFAGFDGAPLTSADVKDALAALGRIRDPSRVIDRLVVSLEGVKWDGNPASKPAAQELKAIDEMRDAWEYLSRQESIPELGVADFSVLHLQHLQQSLSHCVSTSSAPDAITSSSDDMSAGSGGKTGGFAHANSSGLGTGRLPAINQLNVVEDDLPNSITEYAEKEKIALVSHSDELGTQRQFVNLLLEFKDVIPLPEKLKAQEFTSVHEVFRMRWVLKYTIFLPERGLVADNGYVICADFP